MNAVSLLPRTFRSSFRLWIFTAILTLLTLFLLFVVLFQSATLENWFLAIFVAGFTCTFG